MKMEATLINVISHGSAWGAGQKYALLVKMLSPFVMDFIQTKGS